MKTNRFLGRDWIDAELDYSKEEWETLIDVATELKSGLSSLNSSYLLLSYCKFNLFRLVIVVDILIYVNSLAVSSAILILTKWSAE